LFYVLVPSEEDQM